MVLNVLFRRGETGHQTCLSHCLHSCRTVSAASSPSFFYSLWDLHKPSWSFFTWLMDLQTLGHGHPDVSSCLTSGASVCQIPHWAGPVLLFFSCFPLNTSNMSSSSKRVARKEREIPNLVKNGQQNWRLLMEIQLLSLRLPTANCRL